MKVAADFELCQGHGVCAEACPEVFDVEERPGRYPRVVILQARPVEALRARVTTAVRNCPTRALRLEDD
jgi:ferredoxin